jgi:protein polybromo-1
MKLMPLVGRPTEIPEHDVYVCESVYDEARRQVKKLSREGLKKYSHSNAVAEDEIYFFRRLINPPKVRVHKNLTLLCL